MCTQTINCYRSCIDKNFLLPDDLMKTALEIISELRIKATTGRPSIEIHRALNGIYYLLKTGILWKALPKCFGSSSAVHRMFQKLIGARFFKILWTQELYDYNEKHGLKLETQIGDAAHIKSPIGGDRTGKSPVDRRKLGTKRTIIVDQNGIVLGASLGGGNQHDSQLIYAAIKSIPKNIIQPIHKKMLLDAGYDYEFIEAMLFSTNYIPRICHSKRRYRKTISAMTENKRWIVESVHSWMNRFKRLLVRFEKKAINYFGFMEFAFSIMTFNKIRV